MTEDFRLKEIGYARLLTGCCVVTFFSYFAVSMRLPVVPVYLSRFGVTTVQIGVINAAFFLSAGMLSIPSGVLADISGRRRLAMAGTLILFLGMLLLCLGATFPVFLFVYLVLGTGIAAFGPTMMSWVAEFSPPTHLGRSYGWYTTAIFCGMGLGPAAGGLVGNTIDARTVFVIAAVVLAANFFAVWKVLSYSKRRPDRNSGETKWRYNLREVLSNHPLVGCWAAAFGANSITGMFFSFFPLHGDNQGLDVGQIGIVFLVQAAANALSRIPLGVLSDRAGHRKYQALAGIIMISCAISTFGLPEKFLFFTIAGLGLGISNAVAFTSIGALIAETASPRFRGLAMGGYNMAIYFGLMVGSFAFGPVIEAAGFARGFVAAGLLNLPIILFFAWSMRGYPQSASLPAAPPGS